ncbi:MAG: [Ruminiclostridium sp.]|nr:[FeFe] hydrogenase H-cluster maturation GTPase HydF [Ruminiclostridium sp.]
IGVGPVVFVDTAGLDDQGDLGKLRVEKTRQALEKTDLAILVLTGAPDTQELEWLEAIREKKVPTLVLLNKADLLENAESAAQALSGQLGLSVMAVSAQTGQNIPELLQAIMKLVPDDFWDRTLLGDMVGPGDLVLLVMPQDTEAPKGRLILPQVQTTRELLDKKCTVVSTTTDCLQNTLAALAHPPKLIITDANSFPQVWEMKPPESILTAFTILFAGYKGDIRTFLEGASAIEALTENSRVLIAEACSHTHNEEDIGRKKVPALLRKKVGEGLSIDHVQGNDFPQDLSPYDLVIHCGACMFNRRHVMGRIAQADRQKVPITNYGIVLAAVSGILDQVAIPEG